MNAQGNTNSNAKENANSLAQLNTYGGARTRWRIFTNYAALILRIVYWGGLCMGALNVETRVGYESGV